MKVSTLALATTSLLLSSAAAREHGHARRHAHEQFHEKRAYAPQSSISISSSISSSSSVSSAVASSSAGASSSEAALPTDSASCGCTTIWSTWYGEATLVAPPPPASTPSPTSSAAPVVISSTSVKSTPTSTSTPPPPPPPSTTHSSAPAAHSTAAAHYNQAPKPAPSPAPSPPETAPAAPAVAAGGKYGITYEPFGGQFPNQYCKQLPEIELDMALISQLGFTTVRLYSASDCAALPNIHTAAKSNGLKLIVSIYFSSAGSAASDYSTQLGLITKEFGGSWSDVELVLVGNEVINGGQLSASGVASYVSQAKSTLQGAGYSGPVAYAGAINEWASDSETLCGAVDVVAANIYAFFASQPTQPDQAGAYLDQEFEYLSNLCGGKPVVATESGWPSDGGSYGSQQASGDNQVSAIGSILRAKNAGKTCVFDFNSAWKNVPQSSYEAHFTVVDVLKSLAGGN